MQAMPMIGFFELLLLTFMAGSGGGGMMGLMGLPPGERDTRFVQCPPEGVVLYVEWSERTDGQPGAAGIDGLVADPEIRLLLEQIRQAVLSSARRGTETGPPEAKALAEHLPPLCLALLSRPGCAYVSAEAGTALQPAKDAPRWQTILATVRAALIVNGGDRADEIAEHLDALLNLLPEDARGRGFDRRTIPIPDTGLSVTVHRHGDDFIVGLGEGTVERAMAGLDGEAKGLAGNKRFQAAMKHVTVPRTAQVTWIDVKQLTEEVTSALGPQGALVPPVLQMLGADAVESVASCTGVAEGRIVRRTFLTTGGSTAGLLSLAAGRALTAEDFSLIPADADFAAAVSLDLTKILAAVRGVMDKSDPTGTVEKQFDTLLQQWEAQWGFSLEDDFLPALGPVWTLHDSPDAGGVFLTSAVLSLEVRDPRQAYDIFTQLMARLKETMPGEYGGEYGRRAMHLAQTKFLDRTIYYVNSIGSDMPFAPAFCVTDKQLLAAPHPQALKAHLRFLDEQGKSFAARFDETFDLPDGAPIALSYVDPRPLVRWLWALAPYWGQMMFSEIQRERVEIDIFALPSARAILPYIGPSTSSVARTTDGLLFTSESAVPLPAPGLLMVPAMLLRLSYRAQVMEIQ